MTPEQFAYWLQGYAEINQGAPSEEQWKIIRDHLALVFDKVTPNYTEPAPYISPLEWMRYRPIVDLEPKVICEVVAPRDSTARSLC